MTMRKLIKLMFLRFELSHANRMIKHLSTDLFQQEQRITIDEFNEMLDCMAAWRKRADALDEQIKAINAPPCPIDKSETLSPRCPSPLFWVK
jgi:hypothetical protein